MRLIDADVTIEALKRAEALSRAFGYHAVIDAVEELPTVDAVPVVRCRDCKRYQFADNRAFGFPVKRCEWTGFEDVDDDDFCSRGERKDGERHEG